MVVVNQHQHQQQHASFDLETYISHYTGSTRLQRLWWIAKYTDDEAVAAQAFAMLEQQCKQSGNIILYLQVFEQPSSTASEPATAMVGSSSSSQEASGQSAGAPPEQSVSTSSAMPTVTYTPPLDSSIMPNTNTNVARKSVRPLDRDWVENQQMSNQTNRQVLLGRLSTAKAHLQKEAMRIAYLALAEHDRTTGDLSNALGSLYRAMDYCTSRSQTAKISLMILEVTIALKEFTSVRSYISKVQFTLNRTGNNSTNVITNTTTTSSSSSSTSTSHTVNHDTSLRDIHIKLKIASGLERLANDDYANAAAIFHTLTIQYPSTDLEWPEVVSAQDIALYASLLSVTSLSSTAILELAEHHEALELVPSMKELLSQWSRAKYDQCMHAFSESERSSLIPVGDLYIHQDRWKVLSHRIQEKALLEYLRPYQTVNLDVMAKIFPAINSIEDTLFDLMDRGLIQNAKLNSRAKILYKTTTRTTTSSTSTSTSTSSSTKPHVDFSGMERRILDDSHALMIRFACLEHDLIITDKKGLGPANRRRGGGGGVGAMRTAGTTSALGDISNPSHHNPESDDDSDDDDDDDDDPMVDVEPSQQMSMAAANPEDMY